MKKIFMLISSVFLASPIYADAITDGISTAGDAVFSYTSYVHLMFRHSAMSCPVSSVL